MFLIIFVFSWFVLDLNNVIISILGNGYRIPPFEIGGWSQQFAHSLILNSIYGIGIAIFVIFVPLAILVALFIDSGN
jgi:hypothetical protein